MQFGNRYHGARIGSHESHSIYCGAGLGRLPRGRRSPGGPDRHRHHSGPGPAAGRISCGKRSGQPETPGHESGRRASHQPGGLFSARRPPGGKVRADRGVGGISDDGSPGSGVVGGTVPPGGFPTPAGRRRRNLGRTSGAGTAGSREDGSGAGHRPGETRLFAGQRPRHGKAGRPCGGGCSLGFEGRQRPGHGDEVQGQSHLYRRHPLHPRRRRYPVQGEYRRLAGVRREDRPLFGRVRRASRWPDHRRDQERQQPVSRQSVLVSPERQSGRPQLLRTGESGIQAQPVGCDSGRSNPGPGPVRRDGPSLVLRLLPAPVDPGDPALDRRRSHRRRKAGRVLIADPGPGDREIRSRTAGCPGNAWTPCPRSSSTSGRLRIRPAP